MSAMCSTASACPPRSWPIGCGIPKSSNLCRATALLREQNGRLAEFLTTDPKGKLLPEYLATVAEQLAGEHTKLIAKMEAVGQHIEHIKEIVAMQQSYAKVSGVFENLAVSTLVEDALRMNAAAFDRHGIELVREFGQNLPTVRVDRHKVLQILINLLRNAKYAMDAQAAGTQTPGRPGRAGLRPDRVRITRRRQWHRDCPGAPDQDFQPRFYHQERTATASACIAGPTPPRKWAAPHRPQRRPRQRGRVHSGIAHRLRPARQESFSNAKRNHEKRKTSNQTIAS